MNWQLHYYQREVEEGDFPIHFHALKSAISQTDICESWEWVLFYLAHHLTKE